MNKQADKNQQLNSLKGAILIQARLISELHKELDKIKKAPTEKK